MKADFVDAYESNKKTYLIHAIIEVIKQASQKDIPSVIKASVPLINYITVGKNLRI